MIKGNAEPSFCKLENSMEINSGNKALVETLIGMIAHEGDYLMGDTQADFNFSGYVIYQTASMLAKLIEGKVDIEAVKIFIDEMDTSNEEVSKV